MANFMTMSPPAPSLPVRSIPGSYGLPLLGPISDRLDYFWFQGPENFFRKRIEKHGSTVFRTNLPPTFPFFSNVNPNVIAVLDCRSFAHILDSDLVDKSNVLVGDFAPSLKFTGDMRVCAYLDTTDPNHTKVKEFSMDILKRSSNIWISELITSFDTMCNDLEKSISNSGSFSYILPLQKFLFQFLSKCLLGADPARSPQIAESGHYMLNKWLALQLLPIVKIEFLQPLEEILLHSFAYPFFLVSGDYKKLVKFVEEEAKETIERGENEFGLSKEEAIHNLLFILGFNAFGGFTIFLPSLIANLGKDKILQQKLKEEVREQLESSNLTFDSVKNMESVQSFVYETLRYSPPVPMQYGRARRDFQLRSHDAAFSIKKGELLAGFQTLVMRDPKIFSNPEKFAWDRFLGEGRELLNHLYWSNGAQIGKPSAANKQCPGKDVVIATACLIVAYLFLRYDSIAATSSAITAVEMARSSDKFRGK